MDKSRVWDQHIPPPCIKQANRKDLIYSTGNHTQYLVIIYNGKEYYIYIYESLCYISETNTTL